MQGKRQRRTFTVPISDENHQKLRKQFSGRRNDCMAYWMREKIAELLNVPVEEL